MTPNETLASHAISHQIDLTHYSNSVLYRVLATLQRSDARLYSALTDALNRIDRSSFTVDRLESLLGSVRSLNAQSYEQVSGELNSELADFVRYEAAYQRQVLVSVLPVTVHVATISAEAAYTAAYSQPFRISKNGAAPMGQYLAGLSDERAKMIRNAVNSGWLESQTTDQIVRAIRGTKSKQYADGLMESQRRNIEGMVRTATNHMANVTQQRMLEANRDILKGWIFHATLDGRTSITCASLSGKTFPVGEGPIPPRHINCRSYSQPLLKSFKEMGIEIPEFSQDGKTRASMDGQVPADLSFTSWLREKPAAFQNELLGKTRGELFRANKIEIDRFTNNKGIVYSLDDLRKRDAALFKKAKL